MIQTQSEARRSLLRGVNILADIVKTTLGPDGSTVILHTPEGKAYTTKDGVSVARKVFDNDMMVDAGIQLVREGTAKTADEVGDGTTSSTVLAQSLINQCIGMIESGETTAQTLKIEMNEALTDIIERLKSQYSSPVELEENKLTNIATISANNDKELGSLIAKAFIEAGKDGIVLFDKSTTDKTETECTQGMRIDSELLSPAFINNPRSQTAEYEKKDVSVQVLLIDNIVKNIQELAQSTLRVAISQGAPVLLVAHDFTPAVLKEIIQNNIRNNTQILPIKADGFGIGKTECLKDIAAATEATVFDDTKNANAQGFGHCDKVIVSKYNTTIVTSSKIDSTKLDERISALKARIEEESDSFSKKKLQEKLAKLIGKMVIIHVGGITESVAKEKYDRVEDAVYAVKAALEEGYSIGGGMTYLNLFKDFSEKGHSKEYNVVLQAITAPFMTLYKNTFGTDVSMTTLNELFTYASNYGYNFATRNIEDLEEAGVIDPTKVLRVALENAVAVTCLIISTSGIITGE